MTPRTAGFFIKQITLNVRPKHRPRSNAKAYRITHHDLRRQNDAPGH